MKFEWITNENADPYVTVDNRSRLYISRPAKDLLNLTTEKFRLIVGYDFASNRIVLAKPEIVRAANVKPFSFDKRGYSNAKHFVERASLHGRLPVRFIFVGKDYADYPEGSFAFEIVKEVPTEEPVRPDSPAFTRRPLVTE